MQFFLNSITLLFFFIFSDVALCDPDYRYSNCSNTFDCGPIKSIGYPFWGANRPDYCGHPGCLLDCQNGTTEIEITSMRYQVLNINQQAKTLTIARKDFVDDPCPSSYNSTALDPTLFNYTANTLNLTLFYVCPINSADVDVSHRFTCGLGSHANAYYYTNSSNDRPDCMWRLTEPVPQTAGVRLESGQSTVNDVLGGGFEVELIVNDTVCALCGASGGVCGYDKGLQREICFCEDGPRQRRCASSPRPAPAPAPAPGVYKRRKVIIALLVGASSTVAALAILCFWGRKFFANKLMVFSKKKSQSVQNVEQFLMNYGSLGPIRFKYSDVKKMTDSFQDKLGQGGYGSVFKGRLLDRRTIAVKLLSGSKGNGEDFINEVASIGRTSHVNIVTLIGFCVEGTKRALLYEFMPNGSLEKFIYGNTRPHLGWKILYDIALGIARGLEYLHRGCNTRIVHFDIKPHNILLDQDFCPKISDFGLSKLCPTKESVMSLRGARGTPGFIAPELISRNFGTVSHKSDVYSYGMMVLEMVGGRKNVDARAADSSQIYFPEWIYNHLDQSMDFGLQEVTTAEDEEIARKMVLVGLWCIQSNPSNRPPVNKVLDMLEGRLEELQRPPKPFLSSPSVPQDNIWTTSNS